MEWLSWHLKLARKSDEDRGRNAALIASINFLGLAMQCKFAEAELKVEEFAKDGTVKGKCLI